MTDKSKTKNYEDIIIKTLKNKRYSNLFLYLFGDSEKKICNGTHLIETFNNSVSAVYPWIEDMRNEGLVERKVVEMEGGVDITYELEDDFYSACKDFNKNHNNFLVKFNNG